MLVYRAEERNKELTAQLEDYMSREDDLKSQMQQLNEVIDVTKQVHFYSASA